MSKCNLVFKEFIFKFIFLFLLVDNQDSLLNRFLIPLFKEIHVFYLFILAFFNETYVKLDEAFEKMEIIQ
jgi:hypothetical protein